MASTEPFFNSSDSSETESVHNGNVLWEHGDDRSDTHSSSSSFPISASQPTVHSPTSSQPLTPGLTAPLTLLALSSQETVNFLPPTSSTPVPPKRGRPSGSKNKCSFHGNRFTKIATTSTDSSIDTFTSPQSKPRSKRIKLSLPTRGYIAKYRTPYPPKQTKVLFKSDSSTTSAIASTPNGMRLLDVGILAEAMSHIRCFKCRYHLSLFESDFEHGWHTTFSIKCANCHHLYAGFPSSKPMDIPPNSKFVNVQLPKRNANEVKNVNPK